MNNLAIPIEIYQREFHAALCLTESALQKQFTVLLGQKQQVFPYIETFKKAIWFLKSITPSTISYQRRIVQVGSEVVCHDIEGLVPNSGEVGVRLRYSEDTIKLASALFFWGENDHRLFQRVFPRICTPIYNLGTHVVDSWLIKGATRRKRMPTIRGPKLSVLFVSSFPYASETHNKAIRDRTLGSAGKGTDARSRREIDASLDAISSLHQVGFDVSKELVSFIRELPNIELIIRQHPGEVESLWSIFESSNCILSDGSTPIDDELASVDCVFHFNSTVSLQATMQGIPSFMYTGRDLCCEVLDDIHQAVYCSTRLIESLDDVSDLLRSTYLERSQLLAEYLTVNNDLPFSASDAIIDIIKGITPSRPDYSGVTSSQLGPIYRYMKKRIIYLVLEFVASAMFRLRLPVPTFLSVFQNNRKYGKRKWPSQPSESYIRKELAIIAGMRSRKLPEGLRLEKLGTGAYLLSCK